MEAHTTYGDGRKFRAYPTRAQAETLAQWIGCQRVIYNAKVAEDEYRRAFFGKALSLTGQCPLPDQQYSQFKSSELTPWLSEVPSQVLRNGAYRFATAYQRYWKNLAKRPARKKKHGKQSVLLTSELFRFEPVEDGRLELHLGTPRYPVGVLKFKAHREFEIPKTISVSRHNGEWFVSFGGETVSKETLLSEEQLGQYFGSLSPKQLEELVVGNDVGCAVKNTDSSGQAYDLSAKHAERCEKKERRRRKYKKRMAKQVPGSKRYEKTRQKIADTFTYERNVRQEFAHQASRRMIDSKAQVFAFEDVKTKNLTKKPEPKQDENGNFVKNGARAKAALAKRILASAWGNLFIYCAYKARRKNKLVFRVNAKYSSQECASCGYTHRENRPSRARFSCQRCGSTMDADHNAALVIKKRAIEVLLAGYTVREKRNTKFRRKAKAGPERSCQGRATDKTTGCNHSVGPKCHGAGGDVRRERGEVPGLQSAVA